MIDFGLTPEAFRNSLPASSDLAWLNLFRHINKLDRIDESIGEVLHLEWTVRGHFIRSTIDDDALVADVIRQHFPSYQGTKLTLYRGERLDWWLSGKVGFGWSSRQEIAEMFARGIKCDSESGGGVLLKLNPQREAILCGPSAHSLYLNEHEYLLDVRMLGKPIEVCRFIPPPAPPP